MLARDIQGSFFAYWNSVDTAIHGDLGANLTLLILSGGRDITRKEFDKALII